MKDKRFTKTCSVESVYRSYLEDDNDSKINLKPEYQFCVRSYNCRKNNGSTTLDNLRPICSQCNLSMATCNLNDFKNKYFPS
jgi:DNA-directed RNA polymerase alpha subunit